MGNLCILALKIQYREWKTAYLCGKRKKMLAKEEKLICEKGVYIDLKSEFEGSNKLYRGTTLINCFIGYGTYVSHDSYLASVKIGRYCSVGPFVRTVNGCHPTNTFVSTHPTFFSVGKQNGHTYVNHSKFNEHRYVSDSYCIEIGNDVWIGGNVTLLEGIRIGDGAIIAAGAVVTKDVSPYSIVAGVPAQKLRMRFNNDEIDELLSIKWWGWNPVLIESRADYFSSLDALRREIRSKSDDV